MNRSLVPATFALACSLVSAFAESAPANFEPPQLVRPLEGQIVGPLDGQIVRALPGQIVSPLPGQAAAPLPGQIVSALPGQLARPLAGQVRKKVLDRPLNLSAPVPAAPAEKAVAQVRAAGQAVVPAPIILPTKMPRAIVPMAVPPPAVVRPLPASLFR